MADFAFFAVLYLGLEIAPGNGIGKAPHVAQHPDQAENNKPGQQDAQKQTADRNAQHKVLGRPVRLQGTRALLGHLPIHVIADAGNDLSDLNVSRGNAVDHPHIFRDIVPHGRGGRLHSSIGGPELGEALTSGLGTHERAEYLHLLAQCRERRIRLFRGLRTAAVSEAAKGGSSCGQLVHGNKNLPEGRFVIHTEGEFAQGTQFPAHILPGRAHCCFILLQSLENAFFQPIKFR